MKNIFDFFTVSSQAFSRSVLLSVIIGLLILSIVLVRRKSGRRTSLRIPLIVVLVIAGLLILRAVFGLFMVVLIPVLGLLLLAGGAFGGTLWLGKKMPKSKTVSGATNSVTGSDRTKAVPKKI